MTIAIRSFTTATATGAGATVSLSVPAGVLDGDVLYAFLDPIILKGHSPPSGWATGVSATDGGGALSLVSDHRIASSEPGSYNFVFTSTASHAFPCLMVALSGAAASPFDNTSNGGFSSGGTSLVAPTVSATSANSMLLAAFLYQNNGTFTAPAGMTLVGSISGSTNYTLSVCSQLISSTGATGTRTATLGTSTTAAAYAMAVINPATATPQFWTDYIKCAEADS